MKTKQLSLIPALAVLALAGCGGDSGSGSSGIVSSTPATPAAPTTPPPSTPASTVTVTTAKDQTVGQDSSSDPATFSVTDTGGATANVQVTATSSNPSLVDSENVMLGGNGGNRTVMVFPKSGASGAATITLTATGSNGSTGSSTFNVNVTSQPKTTSSMVLAVAAEQNSATPMATTGYAWSDDAANNPNAFNSIVGQ